MSPEREDDEMELERLIAAAFRSQGETFPVSDEEVERFCRSVQPAEPDPALLRRLMDRLASGKEELVEHPEPELTWADRISREARLQPAAGLAREGKEISPEAKEKLEQERQEVEKKLKREQSEGKGIEDETAR